MSYSVKLSDNAIKSMKKLDEHTRKMIMAWIEKNLDGCDNPRAYGKALTGTFREYWRYRVGKYRLMAKIKDDVVEIVIANVGHRDKVYEG